MVPRQQFLYCSKMLPYIGNFNTHLHHNQEEWIGYHTTGQLQDAGYVIEYYSILLLFFHSPHRDPCLHPSNNDFSDPEAESYNWCVDPVQSPVRTGIYGTSHFSNLLAGKHFSKDHFNIFDDDIDPKSSASCMVEYLLAHWCVNHNLRSAAVTELFRNPTMATVRNFSSPHTLLNGLKENVLCFGHQLFEMR